MFINIDGVLRLLLRYMYLVKKPTASMMPREARLHAYTSFTMASWWVHPVTKFFFIAFVPRAQVFPVLMLLWVYFQLSVTVQIPEVPTSTSPPQKRIYHEFSLVLLQSTIHLFFRIKKSYLKNILQKPLESKSPAQELQWSQSSPEEIQSYQVLGFSLHFPEGSKFGF